MKRLIILCLAASLLLGACAAERVNESNSDTASDLTSENEISETESEISLESSETSEIPKPVIPDPIEISIESIGIPLEERYESNNIARTPNDIVLYGGALHVGSGEYSDNSGPIDMYRYDTEKGEWFDSGTLPEEAILRFCVIDDMLYAPGIDARQSWKYGNYYIFNGETWEKKRAIPNGVHVFDIVKYQGLLFFGIGTDGSNHAVVCEDGNGGYRTPRFLEEDGNESVIDPNDYDACRVYDMFVQNGTLFAMKKPNAVYKYDGTDFVYYSEWEDFSTVHIGYDGGTVRKIVFKDTLYIVGGWLYTSSDARTLTKQETDRNDYYCDLYVHNDILYMLVVSKTENNEYKMTVFANESGEADGFYEYCSFEYSIPAVSFAVGDGRLYFGMADIHSDNKLNGTILEAKTLQ